MQAFLQRAWYHGDKRWWWWLPVLWPISLLLGAIAQLRRVYLQTTIGNHASHRPRVPVVVVGNISLGGTGKTPLIAALAAALTDAGWRPGIVSRGYGGAASDYPLLVTADTPAALCGDEPKLLANRTGVPLVVDPDRARAVSHLLANSTCDLVLSDDGLQHYRLHRDVEIAVLDGKRGLGNGLLFPAGPLREPRARLAQVDFCVINCAGALHPSLTQLRAGAVQMNLTPTALIRVKSGEVCTDLAAFQSMQWQAVCGIGNPARFFYSLDRLGYQYHPHSFPDHHAYQADEFLAWRNKPVLMTEKDAVKCRSFAGEDWWYLQVDPQLTPSFLPQLLARLDAAAQGH